MFSITVVLLLQVYSSASSDFLSKFHQHEYKIRDFRAELESYNKEYVNYARVITYKYNRTTPAVNSTLNFKINVDHRLELLVQVYKFASNEYRDFPVRFQANAKMGLEHDVGGCTSILKCGNVTDIFFRKNVDYFVCNTMLDPNHLPPLIPSGQYKASVTFLYLDHALLVTNAYMEFYIPVKIPK